MGPLLMAAIICSLVQLAPVSTGHPAVLNSSSIFEAGWDAARPLGHINPYLPMSSLTGIVVGIPAVGRGVVASFVTLVLLVDVGYCSLL